MDTTLTMMKNSEILTCLQCGTCHASCPSYISLDIRKIVREAVKRDVSEELELWMCTTCYNCLERCPRGIRVTDAVITLRSEAVKKGRIFSPHRKVCRFLIETGHAIPLDEEHRAIREQIGLSLPETVIKYPKALKEVKTLLESTGFIELIKE